jgi:hypothetical protein
MILEKNLSLYDISTHSIFIFDHLNKENKYFDEVEAIVLSKEEEIEMYAQYRSIFAIVKRDMIKEIDWLKNRPWYLA